MRFSQIAIRNSPPVYRFETGPLNDTVVVAGPNGVGKTRLLQGLISHIRGGGIDPNFQVTVEATSVTERETWGKPVLQLSEGNDLNAFRQTLQTSRRRRNWTSSLVNIESNRTIQNLQPLQFSWDMPDPDDEPVAWDMTFGFMRDRFQDTVHSMFRVIEAQRQSIANRAVQLRREGRREMNLNFNDPMEPFKEVFAQLLAPKELVDPSARHQRLQYSVATAVYDFDSLSSGEREVVNVAFDFLLRKPTHCIVVFDEPELHLHPELSFKLLQVLQTIGGPNQFFLTTHSPDVITSSLDQSVIFLSPPKTTTDGSFLNQAIPVMENDETNQALRLLGQSVGVISLGKKIVLIEGAHASLDKQTYGSIVKARHPGLVLVPAGNRASIQAFDSIYDSVLKRTLWGVDFFMLCDGDSTPNEGGARREAQASSRLALLPRYHIENYFLDPEVWARAFATFEPDSSWLRDPVKLDMAMTEIAREVISYACALSVSSRVRNDAGNVSIQPSGIFGKSLEETVAALLSKVEEERKRLASALENEEVERLATETYSRMEESLTDGTWRSLIPGKPIIGKFAAKANLSASRAKMLYLRSALGEETDQSPFEEVVSIFDRFAAT